MTVTVPSKDPQPRWRDGRVAGRGSSYKRGPRLQLYKGGAARESEWRVARIFHMEGGEDTTVASVYA